MDGVERVLEERWQMGSSGLAKMPWENQGPNGESGFSGAKKVEARLEASRVVAEGRESRQES